MGWPKGKPRGPGGKFQKLEPEDDGMQTIDPNDIDTPAGEAASETKTRRPHKKIGGKKSETKFDIQGVEALLLSIHYSLSLVTKMPELAIEAEEAANLARAAGNVARHYDIPEMPAKMIDWANLIICCAATYGPRVRAANKRMKARDTNAEFQTAE